MLNGKRGEIDVVKVDVRINEAYNATRNQAHKRLECFNGGGSSIYW